MTPLMEIRRPDFNWESMMDWWNAHSDGSHTPPPLSEEGDREHLEYEEESQIDCYDVIERVHTIGLYFLDNIEDFKQWHQKKKIVGSLEISDDGIPFLLALLLELQELAEYIDITQELHSINYLAPLFHRVLCYNCDTGLCNKHAAVRTKAAEVVTTMVHNNPTNQQLVMEVNGLQPLLDNFISDPDVTARTKALVAISSLIRNNKPGITEFLLDNGYAALMDALSSESVTLQREALNLIQYLLHENSSDLNIVIELGLQEADIMVHLASSDDAEVREAALRCLLVLARDESGYNGQLVKNDDKLKQVLQERIEGISAMATEDLGAAREEIQLLDSLWNACCYNEPSSLGEKGLLVLPALRDALSPESVTLQREALNQIQHLLHENSWDCNKVAQLGFPRIMMHLTSSDDAQVQLQEAAALRGLVVLARDEGDQLVRNDDKLKQVLQERTEGLIQILVCLPVVSLLRFKAVCKSWRDLIHSPFFVDLHTTTTLNSSSKFGSFIVKVCNFDINGKYQLLMLSSQSDDDYESESGGSNDHEEEEEEGPVVVVDDLGIDMDHKLIVGSCNGLVCLHHIDFDFKPNQVYLWNPATRQCMILPESKTNPRFACILVAFGFDVETKDYKVVQFIGLKSSWNGNGPEFCFCEAQVYSLSSHSWRRLEGIPCLPGYPFAYEDTVVYLNGTCFFLAHYFYTKRYPCVPVNDRFIISFDFTKEILTPIQLPDHHRDQVLCLCSLGDHKIALFTSPNRRIFKGDGVPIGYLEDFTMWVLNYECGSSSSGSSVNKESWTKLHSFKIQINSQYEWYKPRGISSDGKFALLESGYGDKMNLYNFATKEVKRDFLVCSKVMSNACAYKPSLVSVIGGGNGAGRRSSSQIG